MSSDRASPVAPSPPPPPPPAPVTVEAPPPPPPAPTVVKPKASKPDAKSKSKDKRFERVLDPREELMIAIRSFKGREGLTSVSLSLLDVAY